MTPTPSKSFERAKHDAESGQYWTIDPDDRRGVAPDFRMRIGGGCAMTEYALSERDRWAVMQPVLSEEVIETWDERAPPEARSPEFGWLFSAPLERDARTHCRVYHGLTDGGQYYGALFEIDHLEEFDEAPVVTDVSFIRYLNGDTYREQLWALARSSGGVVDEGEARDPMADKIPQGNLPRTHTISDRIAEKRVGVSA